MPRGGAGSAAPSGPARRVGWDHARSLLFPDDVPGLAAFLGLSDRQTLLVGLALDDLSECEMGERLGISHNTVRTHMRRLYAKLGVAGRSQLLLLVSANSLQWRCGRCTEGRGACPPCR